MPKIKKVIIIFILQRLQCYSQKLRETQMNIKTKLDNTDEEKEDLCAQREEQLDALDEIIETLGEVISLVEEYNSQWNGIKSIK